MKLYILNENCVQAGQQADDARSYDECGDVTVYEGTPEELLEVASLMESANRLGSRYSLRVAATIREAVYMERPDLEPVESADAD